VKDTEWEYEAWLNILWRIRNGNLKLGSIFRRRYGIGIRNLVRYFLKDKEWELETWLNILWRIRNGKLKFGSVFLEDKGRECETLFDIP
jgi:hypothetical protein